MELTHTAADSSVIASFSYELDGAGNRIKATETIRQPGQLGGVEAFLEENGLLVLEPVTTGLARRRNLTMPVLVTCVLCQT